MQVGPCISVGIHPSKQILSAKGAQVGGNALRTRHNNGVEVRKKRPRRFKKRPRGFK